MAKRSDDEFDYEDDDFDLGDDDELDEDDYDDDDDDDDDSDDDDNDDNDDDDDDDDDDEEEQEDDDDDGDEEEPPKPEPDHPDALAALRDLGARLDLNDAGNVWRIFFYDRHEDKDLAQIHGLPALKEVWVIGTRISSNAVKMFKEEMPNVKVYE